MATKETYGVMGAVDKNGDLNIHYPISKAELVTYDNSESDLQADNTQAAIDEVAAALGGLTPIIGTSDPTTETAGKIGQHYINTKTPSEWTCVAKSENTYTWVEGGGGSGGSLVLSALRIQTAPTKTAYKAGEVFDPTGMIVVADYTLNGITIAQNITVTGYSYPTGTLAAGTKSVTITYTEGGVTLTATQKITCTKTDVPIPTFDGTLTFNGTEQTPTLTNDPGSLATKSGDTAATNAGDYTETLALNDTDLYQWADGTTENKSVPWSIGKVTPTVTAPTLAATMTYNGSSRNLTTSAGSTNYGTLQYSTDGTTWSATAPTATNAGDYNVRYRIVGDDNINSVAATSAGTVTINKKATTISVSPTSVTLNSSNKTATATITTDGDGTLSASTSSSGVATGSINGKTLTISHVNETSGTAIITINQAAGTNYAAASCTVSVSAEFVPALANATPAQIKSVAQAGTGANYWKVGDKTAAITFNNVTVGGLNMNGLSASAFILSFAHNTGKEGTGIHFQFGKTSAGVDIAWVNSYGSTGTGFCMNTTNTNSGGWSESYMRKTICAAFLNALPTAWQNIIAACTKYSDNTGGGSDTAGNVTSTSDKIWLLSEWEVQGAKSYANTAEKNYQEQYAYYANGNSKVKYQHTATTSPCIWWLRSVDASDTTIFCIVDTGGSANINIAYYSYGFAPGFKVA